MSLFFKSKLNEQILDVIGKALATPPPADDAQKKNLASQFLAGAQPELLQTINTALAQTPPPAGDQAKVAAQLIQGLPVGTANGGQNLAWERVAGAAALLGLLFWAVIYTAHDEALKDLSKALLNTFTVVLSSLGTIIIGESAKKS